MRFLFAISELVSLWSMKLPDIVPARKFLSVSAFTLGTGAVFSRIGKTFLILAFYVLFTATLLSEKSPPVSIMIF